MGCGTGFWERCVLKGTDGTFYRDGAKKAKKIFAKKVDTIGNSRAFWNKRLPSPGS
jgi:hypothetical protein